MFATRWNHKLLLFVFPVPDSLAMGVDALSMSWKELWAYAYPPPALLPRMLEKAQWDQCELIVAARWPQAIWFPLLLGVLIQYPLRIPNNPRLLSQPRNLIHRYPSNLQLHQWKISGMPSAAEAFHSTLPPVSTLASYKSKWRIFSTWCKIQQIDSRLRRVYCRNFLRHLYLEKHLAISNIAGYQMAITSTFCATSSAEVGRNPALMSLLRNIEMNRGTINVIFLCGISP